MRKKNPNNKTGTVLAFLAAVACLFAHEAFARDMSEQPRIRLRSLEKTTARTMTFEADVGSTLKFGALYIKVQSCQKSSPVDLPEAAAFLQIWEDAPEGEKKPKDGAESQWVFSGWMFSSAPALSPMDHPIYDVWVMDCMGAEGEPSATASVEADDDSGIAPDAEQPPETKNFNSLLEGLTGVSAEPAVEGTSEATGEHDAQMPAPPAPAETQDEPDSSAAFAPIESEVLEDETQGLPDRE